jgi:hypothetical protein
MLIVSCDAGDGLGATYFDVRSFIDWLRNRGLSICGSEVLQKSFDRILSTKDFATILFGEHS